MAMTKVTGGKDLLEAALTSIIAGGTPNIQVVVQAEKGTWLIIHVA